MFVRVCLRESAGRRSLFTSVCPSKEVAPPQRRKLSFFFCAERSWSVLCSLALSHTNTLVVCDRTERSVSPRAVLFFAKAFCDPRDDLGRSEVKCGSSRTDVLSCRRRCASSVWKKACYDPTDTDSSNCTLPNTHVRRREQSWSLCNQKKRILASEACFDIGIRTLLKQVLVRGKPSES